MNISEEADCKENVNSQRIEYSDSLNKDAAVTEDVIVIHAFTGLQIRRTSEHTVDWLQSPVTKYFFSFSGLIIH